MRQSTSYLDQLLIQSGKSLAVVAVAAVALAWFLAGRVLRPLSKITTAARRISASSLHERLALRGPDDELKELGDTLDDLFGRLEAAFDAQGKPHRCAAHPGQQRRQSRRARARRPGTHHDCRARCR